MSARAVLAPVVVGTLLVTACSRDYRDDQQQVVRPAVISPFDARTGDCVLIDPEARAAITELRVVPCADGHNSEVFGRVTLDVDSYDLATVGEAVEEGCLGAFEGYVGRSPGTSDLDAFVYAPDHGTFVDGRRHGICLLWDPVVDLSGDALTQSMRGSER